MAKVKQRHTTDLQFSHPSQQKLLTHASQLPSRPVPVAPSAAGRWPVPPGGVAGSRHAWNQPHPRGGRHPREPARRVGLPRRPGPHDQRGELLLDHHHRVQLPPARGLHLRRPPRRAGARDHAQRARPRPGHGLPRLAHRAARSPRRQRPGRAGRVPLLPQRGGPAPLRRPCRRPRLPLQPVRGRRRTAGLRLLRPAGPEVGLPLRGDGPVGLEGRLQRTQPAALGRRATAPPVGVRADPPDVDLRHRRGGR